MKIARIVGLFALLSFSTRSFSNDDLSIRNQVAALNTRFDGIIEKKQVDRQKEIQALVQQGMSILLKSVEVLRKTLEPVLLAKTVVLAIHLNRYEGSAAVAEVLAPLYQEQKKSVDRELNKFSLPERKKLKKEMKAKIIEQSQGNG